MDQQQAHKTMHDLFKLMVSKKASDLFIAGHIFKGEVQELKEAMVKGRESGNQTFDMALFDLAEKGVITRDEAMRNADSVNDLRVKFRLESKSAGSTAEFKGAAALSLDSDLTKKLGLDKKK